MSEKVELRPAYSWDCPECGREYFIRGLVPEMSEDELAELRDEHGVQPWEVGDFIQMPEQVGCPSCLMTFDTVRFREDDE